MNEIKDNKLKSRDNAILAKTAKSIGFKIAYDESDNISEIFREYKGVTISIVRYNKDNFQCISYFDAKINEKFYIKSINGANSLEFDKELRKNITGNNAFDNSYLLFSSVPYILFTFLTSSIREYLIELAETTKSVEIKKENISIIIPEKVISDYKVLKIFINQLNDLSKHFSDIPDVKERLIANLKTETDKDIKLKIITILNECFVIDEKIESVLAEIVVHENDVMLQIEAAKYLEDEGLYYLTELLQSKNNLSNDQKITILNFLEENNRRTGKEEPVLYLNNRKLTIAIANSFRVFTEECIDEFVERITEPADHDLSIHVILSLGNHGSGDAVKNLKNIMRSTKNSVISNGVIKSIDAIQSKLKGMLSTEELSEKDGALSIDNSADNGSLTIEEVS